MPRAEGSIPIRSARTTRRERRIPRAREQSRGRNAGRPLFCQSFRRRPRRVIVSFTVTSDERKHNLPAAGRHGDEAEPPDLADSPVAEWSVDAVAEVVVDAARHVHAALGPGLLEHVYEVVLGHELIRRGLPVERQRMFPVRYGRIVVDKGFRTDIVVDRRLLIEVKTAARLAAVHRQQVMTYCRMAGFRLGLLINFGGETMDVGVQRIEVTPRGTDATEVSDAS